MRLSIPSSVIAKQLPPGNGWIAVVAADRAALAAKKIRLERLRLGYKE